MATKEQKLQKLLQDKRSVYHVQDLAVLWGISNRNTLYTILSRYTRKGILKKIQKGLYATVPVDQIDPVELGLRALRRYGYLSTESVLAKAGVIFQEISQITLVSSCSGRFQLANHRFLVRQLKAECLYNQTGVVAHSSGGEATVERAVADLLYYDPSYHFDAPRLVDWEKVEKIKRQVGY